MPEISDNYEITGFFYNPNIDDAAEYELRRAEMEKYAGTLGIPLVCGKYDSESWKEAVKGLEHIPEGGARCEVCFRYRLEETARYAEENNFDLYGTTLTLSPLKNAKKINQIGGESCENLTAKYLDSDFKKKDGYKKSVQRSTENGLYRQNYCGCSYGKKIQDERNRK
ncbi:MAG: epoxyqueuosine reductase QueH [Firmicutes bacterium]|nr:epoxyqueuosine reductase QueH [Bacillota bacterium]